MVESSDAPSARPSDTWHQWVDHTSEVTMRVRAPDFPSLVGEATRAFAELVPDSLRRGSAHVRRGFHIPASDRVASLVGWLNEIVYLCEADRWLPLDVEAVEDESGLHVQATGTPLSRPFVLVKAATLHGAAVRRAESGLEGEVTLDV